MSLLIHLQAFDQNKQAGFPRKDRKFHFTDPFITHTLLRWLHRMGLMKRTPFSASQAVEACVASLCHRLGRVFYFKGDGEIDVIWLYNQKTIAIEVKWTNQL